MLCHMSYPCFLSLNRRVRHWWRRSQSWNLLSSRPWRTYSVSGRNWRAPPAPRPSAYLMLTGQSSSHRAAPLWMSGWKTLRVSCIATTMGRIWPVLTSCLRSIRYTVRAKHNLCHLCSGEVLLYYTALKSCNIISTSSNWCTLIK